MGILRLPEGTARMTVLIRHSEGVQNGPQETRTLTPEGVDLCHQVQLFYEILLIEFAKGLGITQVSCWSSEFIRAILTSWELFRPSQLHRTPLLNLVASLTQIEGGAWFKARKAEQWAVPQMILTVIKDESLQMGQPFVEGTANYRHAITRGDDKLRACVGHEPHISFAAHGYIPDDQLGLNECEAVVFYVDDAGTILGAEKIIPSRSFKALKRLLDGTEK